MPEGQDGIDHGGRKPGRCVHHPDTQHSVNGRRVCGGCGALWNPDNDCWEYHDGSVDYTAAPGGPVHVTSELQGVLAKCMFHPESAQTPEHRVALATFGIACYGVLMTHGEGLPIMDFSRKVVERYESAMRIIVSNGHNHDPDTPCAAGCPIFDHPDHDLWPGTSNKPPIWEQ